VCLVIGDVHLELQFPEAFGGLLGLRLAPPLDEHVDADHLNPPPIGKSTTVIPSSHGTLLVIIDELAQYPCRGDAGKLTEVDRTFGVTSTSEDTALSSSKWDHVTRFAEV